jgi:hypothetical protein
VDASLIVADANKQGSTTGARWNRELDAEAVSRATKEYLATLDDAPTRATLVAAIARGRRWLSELTMDASLTTDRIAKRERCSLRKVNMTISLAFLAPDLVKAAIDGRLPYGMGIARLTDLPAEWSRQREMLGFPSH